PPRTWSPSADEAAVPQLAEPLLEDGLALGVGAALLHVGQVGLVDLGRGGRRGVVLVAAGRQATALAHPLGRDLHALVDREGRGHLVAVGAPVGDKATCCGLAALGLTHRSGADTAA